MQSLVFTEASDVWSFGIVCVEIFQDGVAPYANIPNEQVIVNVQMGKRVLQEDVRCNDDIYALLEECWGSDTQQRPTFSQLVNKLKDLQEEAMLASGASRSGGQRATTLTRKPTINNTRRQEKRDSELSMPQLSFGDDFIGFPQDGANSNSQSTNDEAGVNMLKTMNAAPAYHNDSLTTAAQGGYQYSNSSTRSFDMGNGIDAQSVGPSGYMQPGNGIGAHAVGSSGYMQPRTAASASSNYNTLGSKGRVRSDSAASAQSSYSTLGGRGARRDSGESTQSAYSTLAARETSNYNTLERGGGGGGGVSQAGAATQRQSYENVPVAAYELASLGKGRAPPLPHTTTNASNTSNSDSLPVSVLGRPRVGSESRPQNGAQATNEDADPIGLQIGNDDEGAGDGYLSVGGAETLEC